MTNEVIPDLNHTSPQDQNPQREGDSLFLQVMCNSQNSAEIYQDIQEKSLGFKITFETWLACRMQAKDDES